MRISLLGIKITRLAAVSILLSRIHKLLIDHPVFDLSLLLILTDFSFKGLTLVFLI
jgi:hypothetical protein